VWQSLTFPGIIKRESSASLDTNFPQIHLIGFLGFSEFHYRFKDKTFSGMLAIIAMASWGAGGKLRDTDVP